MRILIAPNSFKNCLGARAVGEAIARGLRAARADIMIDVIPMSDGGDGLVDAVAGSLAGERITSPSCDALGRPIEADWLLTGEFALIEMALASGLARLRGPQEYRPLVATSAGTGMLIAAALKRGCRRIVLGLGGSATVDAGCGMAAALGFRLLTAQGQPLPEGGGALGALASVEQGAAGLRLRGAKFTCLVDIQNPLLGSNGASRVFAPQKGASAAEVEQLESNLAHWAGVMQRDSGVDLAALPGGGAAGGLGAGCVAFLGADLENGAAWVARQNRLKEAIAAADLVITGEGRLDEQTAFGKVPAFVARLAQSLGKRVIAMGGSVAPQLDLRGIGVSRCIAVTPPGTPLARALREAENNLASAAAGLIMDM